MNYLVKAVRDYAVDNIDKDDWDLLVHYFTDADIEKLIAGSQRTWQTNSEVLKTRAINAVRLAISQEKDRMAGRNLPVNELPEVHKK